MLREAADQVEGQLAGSLARRLDAARSLSEWMTRRMEELANLVPGDGQATALPGRGKNKNEEQQPTQSRPNSQRGSGQQSAMARGSGTAGQESSAQQRQASRLSDSTQALDDLLNSISRRRSADAAQSPPTCHRTGPALGRALAADRAHDNRHRRVGLPPAFRLYLTRARVRLPPTRNAREAELKSVPAYSPLETTRTGRVKA